MDLIKNTESVDFKSTDSNIEDMRINLYLDKNNPRDREIIKYLCKYGSKKDNASIIRKIVSAFVLNELMDKEEVETIVSIFKNSFSNVNQREKAIDKYINSENGVEKNDFIKSIDIKENTDELEDTDELGDEFDMFKDYLLDEEELGND